MPLSEAVLIAITKEVFTYLVKQSGIDDRVRARLGLDPVEQAFRRALGTAISDLEQHYPKWTASLFDASFLEHEAAPVLAQYLIRDGSPDPTELAALWADSLNLRPGDFRTTYTRQLEPVAADFMSTLSHELQKEPELRDLNNDRAFERVAAAVEALRHAFGADRSTPGTRRDYLRWLIQRNLYLDARGTFQTQRQVQLKLEDVYVSLSARLEHEPGSVDRRLLAEQQEIEVKSDAGHLRPEEAEDQLELVLARYMTANPRVASSADVEVGLAEAVTQHDRLVVLGDPGGGKSTLLKYLAVKHARALLNVLPEAGNDLGPTRFPILVRIADYIESNMWQREPLSEFVAETCRLHECPALGLQDMFESELGNGNCLVLLDGLDEVVSADERRSVVQRILEFVDRHGHHANQFVVTSRVAGYASAPLGASYAHYAIEDMNTEQIERFLNQWCRAVEDAETPELTLEERENKAQTEVGAILRAVEMSPGVRRLATNPLLLRTLALIHRTGAQLPQKRIELYKLAADTLARTWRTAQGVPESALVKDEYLTRLLRELAYWLHKEKPTGIATEREVNSILGAEWARIKGKGNAWDPDDPDPEIMTDVDAFLSSVRVHTGLFVLRAPKRYGFMHLTFEEYYAARQIVARSKTRAEMIRKHLHDPRWEEPILLALGFVGLDYPDEAADLLDTAILAFGEDAVELGYHSSAHEKLLGRDYLFALRCLGDGIPANPSHVEDFIRRSVREFVDHEGLGQFQAYRQALKRSLNHFQESPITQRLEETLVSRLEADSSASRRHALEAIQEWTRIPDAAVPALVTALRDADPEVREVAAACTWYLKPLTEEVIAALVRLVLHDREATVRTTAAAALIRSQGAPEAAIPTLVAALQDEEAEVRAAAATSFAWGQIVPEAAVPTLVAALQDDEAEVRAAAAYGLSRGGRPQEEVTATLVEMTLHDPAANVRAAATATFFYLDTFTGEVMAALVAALRDPEAEVRAAAATALWSDKAVPDEVMAALVAALRDPEAVVRAAAASSFVWGRFIADEVMAALVAALRDPEAEVRAAAAAALSRIQGAREAVVPAVIAALDDPVADVREWALMALGHTEMLSDEIFTSLVIMTLHDPAVKVRAAAGQALGAVPEVPEEVIAEIASLLRESWDTLGPFYQYRLCTLLVRHAADAEGAEDILRKALLDSGRFLASGYADLLVELSRRSRRMSEKIESIFVEILENYELSGAHTRDAGGTHEAAYRGLSKLMSIRSSSSG